MDIDARNLVFSGVDLNEEDVGVILKESSSLFVVRNEMLAMSTPWGIEFNEDLFVGIEDNLLVVLSDDHLDGLVIWLGNLSRFKVLFDGSTLDSGDEAGQCLNIDFFSIEFIFFAASTEVKNLRG